MSTTGTIDFTLIDDSQITIIDLLDVFLSKGWNLDNYGSITYLPLGDEDFDWIKLPLNEVEEFYKIIQEKSDKNEIIGNVLMWKDTKIGISCLFYPSLRKITMDAMINRKIIENMETTDFSWYLEKIIPILKEVGLSVDLIECQDSYY